jgi:4'-phosphopantetheinyl transferase
MTVASANVPAPRLPAHWRTPSPAEPIGPGAGEVVLVATSLDPDPGRLEALRATFSPREEDRFRSFATDALRTRWGAGRGTLREVLGRVLSCAPSQVELRYGRHGKPQAAGSPVRFNISHSGALAVIALALAEVGVDVELPRVRRSDAIARRFYAPAEIERLFAETDPAARADAFFRLWTCKEAFLKATGEGLSRSTRSYEIALRPPRLVWATGIPDAGRYSVHPLEVGEPYRGALVAEMPRASLRHFRWG